MHKPSFLHVTAQVVTLSLVLLSAGCGGTPAATPSGETQATLTMPSGETRATLTTPSKDSGGGGGSRCSVSITSPQVPPTDVLQQVAYYPGGGDPGVCKHDCFDISGNRIMLYGFEPNQSLRILVYRDSGSPGAEYLGVSLYITEWCVAVDENGYLELDVSGDSPSSYSYIVLDARDNDTLALVGHNYAWGAIVPNGGFSRGSIVQSNSGDDRLNVRSGPGYSSNIIDKVNHGDRMTIIGNARIVNDERWWPVKTSNGTEGWVTELWITSAR